MTRSFPRLLDGSLRDLDGALEVGLPDVTAVDDTGGEDRAWGRGRR